jgi:hypothetical protein
MVASKCVPSFKTTHVVQTRCPSIAHKLRTYNTAVLTFPEGRALCTYGTMVLTSPESKQSTLHIRYCDTHFPRDRRSCKSRRASELRFRENSLWTFSTSLPTCSSASSGAASSWAKRSKAPWSALWCTLRWYLV